MDASPFSGPRMEGSTVPRPSLGLLGVKAVPEEGTASRGAQGTGSCTGLKDEGSDKRRRGPTPAHARAVGGRLSNLQGQEGVDGRRSERRRQVPLGRRGSSDKGPVRSLGFESGEHRL